MVSRKLTALRALAILMAMLAALFALPVAAAGGSQTAYVGVTSDVHGSVSNFTAWLQSNGSGLEHMVFGGDLDNQWSPSTVDGLNAAVSAYNASNGSNIRAIYTMGNHDWMGGSEAAFKSATGFERTGVQNNPAADGYTIYTLGTPSDAATSYEFTNSDVSALAGALAASAKDRPFFIVSHYPLHYGDGRPGRNASALIDLLNSYPNVFFFWGHSHHSDPNMGTIKTAGETIEPADAIGTQKAIYFTYCNSGHMGAEHSNDIARDGTGVKIEIETSGARTTVTLRFNRKDGTTVTTKSVELGSVPYVAVTGIAPPAAGNAPDADAAVAGGFATCSNVAWNPNDSVFQADTRYTASVRLTPLSGFVFTPQTAATVNGSPATAALNPDGTITVSFEFPKTQDPNQAVVYRKATSVESGREYTVVLGGKAMNTTAKTGSASGNSYTGLGYFTPQIDGDYLTFATQEQAEAATWRFDSADGGGWHISSGGKYLKASAGRTMALGSEPQAWTYGELGNKGKQIYVNIGGTDYNLCWGKNTTVDFIYPSANNNNTLALYEKVVLQVQPVDTVAVTGIEPPATGCAPDLDAEVSFPSGAASAGPVAWTPAPAGGVFAAGTYYTASLTLTPSIGYKFTTSTAATVNGSPATAALNPDGTITVSIAFPATANEPYQRVTYVKAETIVDGGEYAVVLDGKAMNTTAKTGSYNQNSYVGLGYFTPQIDGDCLTFDSPEQAGAATWRFDSADGGGWHISSGGKYLKASAGRTMALGSEPQAWTYGELGSKGKQIYVNIGGTDYNLCWGGQNTVDLVYPSSHNSNALALYKKIATQINPVGCVEVTVDAPQTGQPPDMQADANGNAIVKAVDWTPAPDGTFVPETVYVASVTLAPAEGYVFTQTTCVKINGVPACTAMLSDGALAATRSFPQTSAADPSPPPSEEPGPSPSEEPSPSPSEEPGPSPSEEPSPSPSEEPGPSPSEEPGPPPSEEPGPPPSEEPGPSPSEEPSPSPSEEPSPSPSEEPSPSPSEDPSPSPSEDPSPSPSEDPSPSPSEEPGPSPSEEPSPSPGWPAGYQISFVIPYPYPSQEPTPSPSPSPSPSEEPYSSASIEPSPAEGAESGVAGDVDKTGNEANTDETGVAGEVEKLPQTGGVSPLTVLGLIGIALAGAGGAIYVVFGGRKHRGGSR